MTGFLLISQIVLVVVLTITVLLQKSSSIGLGAYSGSNESVFGAKGPGSFLAKTTFFLGFLFVANTIALGYYYGEEHTKSVVDTVVEGTNVPAPKISSVPEIPVASPAADTNTSPAATEAPPITTPDVATESNNTSAVLSTESVSTTSETNTSR